MNSNLPEFQCCLNPMLMGYETNMIKLLDSFTSNYLILFFNSVGRIMSNNSKLPNWTNIA